MKSISVIIPAYNAEKVLSGTIASCFSQTLAPAEVIVIDDGSLDGTPRVIEDFGDRVRGKRVDNGGVSRARNIGAGMASGDFLVFLDSDDVLLPHALEALAQAIAGAGVAYGMVIERVAPPGLAKLNGFGFAQGKPPVPAERSFWRGAVITPGSAMVRADLHQKVGGFVSGYEPLEDRDYWIKCGLLAPVAFVDSVVLDKRWAADSHGSQHAKRIYRGQRAQRDLRGWCQKLEVDCSWMPSDTEIVKRALDEALWRKEFSILKPLREVAISVGVRHWKSEILSHVMRLPQPDWIKVEPGVYHP